MRRNRSGIGWFGDGRHCGSTGRSASVATTGGRAAAVAATIDDVISAQAQSLFGLTSHTTIAIAQRTGQGRDDFGAAAAVLTNLITDLVGSHPANSFISIVQTIDEGRHDFRIADAIIAIAEFPQGSTSLTGIAGRLRLVDQASNFTRIGIAATGIHGTAVRTTAGTAVVTAVVTAGGSTARGAAAS